MYNEVGSCDSDRCPGKGDQGDANFDCIGIKIAARVEYPLSEIVGILGKALSFYKFFGIFFRFTPSLSQVVSTSLKRVGTNLLALKKCIIIL